MDGHASALPTTSLARDVRIPMFNYILLPSPNQGCILFTLGVHGSDRPPWMQTQRFKLRTSEDTSAINFVSSRHARGSDSSEAMRLSKQGLRRGGSGGTLRKAPGQSSVSRPKPSVDRRLAVYSRAIWATTLDSSDSASSEQLPQSAPAVRSTPGPTVAGQCKSPDPREVSRVSTGKGKLLRS